MTRIEYVYVVKVKLATGDRYFYAETHAEASKLLTAAKNDNRTATIISVEKNYR